MSAGASSTTIRYNNMQFLICITPNPFYISQYIKNLQKWKVNVLVRASEQQYDTKPFTNAGIKVIDLVYPDGQFPSSLIVEDWLEIVYNHFKEYPESTLAVHCRCGLGRSAVLVAVALMESGVTPMKAIQIIRRNRRGAFNKTQFDRICVYQSSRRFSCDKDDEFRCKNKQCVLF